MKRSSSGVLIGLIVVVAVAAVAYAVLTVAKPHQITVSEAQKACDDLLARTTPEIQAVTGYTVVESGKRCETVQDELSNTDYKLGAYFRLVRADGTALAKHHLDEAAAKLPTGGDHPWQLSNEPATASQPEVLCIATSKYLNNDGTYVDQHFQDKIVKFHEASSSEPYTSLCTPAAIKS